MFEIKILVNENKESDDKNQAAVNKKLNDIVEKKGNVNEQLNNLLYQLTNNSSAVKLKLSLKIMKMYPWSAPTWMGMKKKQSC